MMVVVTRKKCLQLQRIQTSKVGENDMKAMCSKPKVARYCNAKQLPCMDRLKNDHQQQHRSAGATATATTTTTTESEESESSSSLPSPEKALSPVSSAKMDIGGLQMKLESTPGYSNNESKLSQKQSSVSQFEQRRLDNIKANAEFLASLCISETKQSLSNYMKPLRKRDKSKVKASTRGVTLEVFQREPISLRPRESLSLRSQKLNEDDFLSLPASPKQTKRAASQGSRPSRRGYSEGKTVTSLVDEQHRLAEELTFDQAWLNKSDSNMKRFLKRVEDGCPLTEQLKNNSLDELVAAYKNLVITPERVAKVTAARVCSLAVHPREHESPLVVAGDKNGHIGFWNVLDTEGDDGVMLFRPHLSPVYTVEFSPSNPNALFSCSYDGTVRRCDIEKQVFDKVYATNSFDIELTYFSVKDDTFILVTQTDGCVALVDSRSNGFNVFDMNRGRLKCVHRHPVQNHYFITSSAKGTVDLFDSRALSTCQTAKPVTTLTSPRNISSAFFSPLTGNQILTTSADNTIKLYNSENLTNMSLVKNIPHNNHTGRWLSSFRATWHPCREDCFVVGSLSHPRKIELFGTSGHILHNFCDDEENLRSVCSVNAFHPAQIILVGANSSGRLHAFM